MTSNPFPESYRQHALWNRDNVADSHVRAYKYHLERAAFTQKMLAQNELNTALPVGKARVSATYRRAPHGRRLLRKF